MRARNVLYLLVITILGVGFLVLVWAAVCALLPLGPPFFAFATLLTLLIGLIIAECVT